MEETGASSSSTSATHGPPIVSALKALTPDGCAATKRKWPVDCGQDRRIRTSPSLHQVMEAGTQASDNVALSFNLLTGNYEEFINKLRTALADHKDPEPEIIRGGRPVLARQQGHRSPKRWMKITLVSHNNEETTLAVRDDNVYLIGFKTQNGRWYEFGFNPCKKVSCAWHSNLKQCPTNCKGAKCDKHRNREQCQKERELIIKMKGHNPTFLECDVSYAALLSGTTIWDEFPEIKLGKISAIQAVGILSGYNQLEGEKADPATRRALACLILMFCEATRMIPFYNTVLASWDDREEKCRIRWNQVKYVWCWGDASQGLLEWETNGYGKWGRNEKSRLGQYEKDIYRSKSHSRNDYNKCLPWYGIESAADALGVIQLILHRGFPARNAREAERRRKKEERRSKEEERENNSRKGNHGKGNEEAGDVEGNKENGEASNNQGNQETGESSNNKGSQETGQDGYNDGKEETEKHKHTTSATGHDKQLAVVAFGRALAEVFRVSANSSCVVATVSVFDGKRGQIIYRDQLSHHPETQGMIDLALTGPYRAISAGGSFTIQVDGSDKSGRNVGGEVVWDCYSVDAVYGKVLTQGIPGAPGSASIAEVTYAVLGDAVEANVQVQLKLKTELKAVTFARIHGEITAHNPHFGENSVLLFRSAQEDEMEVDDLITSDGLTSIPIPLARSVVVASLDLPLLLEIKLYAAFSPNNENVVSVHEHMSFSLLQQHTGEIEKNGVVLQVKITSPHIYALPEQSDTTVPVHIDDNLVLTPQGEQKGKLVEGDMEVISEQSDTSLPPVLATTSSPGMSTLPRSKRMSELKMETDSIDEKKQAADSRMPTLLGPSSRVHTQDEIMDGLHRVDAQMKMLKKDTVLQIMSSKKVEDLTLHVLEQCTNRFSEELKIGSGGFGEVYRAVLNGCEIAVKKLYLKDRSFDDQSFTDEFRQLTKVQHENIIRLIDYCYEKRRKFTEYHGEVILCQVIDRALCFEYMHGGSLANHISDGSCIHDWATTFKIIKGTCEGLHYLHRGHIYHQDLKPDNILLDKDMVPKIADFGLSRLFGESETHKTIISMAGTLEFMAPEYIYEGVRSPKNDVFSLGVIIFYLVAGRKGYGDYRDSPSSREEFIQRVQEYWKKRMRAAADYTWDEINLLGVKICTEIAMNCVEKEWKNRPSTKGIIDELDAQMEKMSKKDTQSLTGQRNSDCRDITLDPSLVLRFPFKPNMDINCCVELTNEVDSFIAFNIKTNRKKYITWPSKGIILPFSKSCITVTLQAQEGAPPNMQCLDKFIVQSRRVSEDFTSQEITQEFLEETTAVDEVILPIAYIALE